MVVSLCTKPMKTAEYMCTGTLGEDADFGHYALNMPFYTHFTSPIRRYPDVLVHRLLEAALEMDRGGGGGGGGEDSGAGSALQHIMGLDAARQGKICKNCNQKKSNSKQAQEASDKIHMCVMLRAKPMEVRKRRASLMTTLFCHTLDHVTHASLPEPVCLPTDGGSGAGGWRGVGPGVRA